MLNPALKASLATRLLAMADDELVLAHRNSEWTGHAPMIEEDIALANIAQDELGHATLWYGCVAEMRDQPATYPDHLVFFRDAPDWLNAQLLELPKGDWAFTMLRQYLFDQYEWLLLAELAKSQYAPIIQIATKIQREELYHLRHSTVWLKRLGLGTVESKRRMQDALNCLWQFTSQLFSSLPGDDALVSAGLWADMALVYQNWHNTVSGALIGCELVIPITKSNQPIYARGDHSEHLLSLLHDLQLVARADPTAQW
jgi:ring-1,2-phenylacetyl-CoA epoxidase subunit PaaC